ncbi:metallophosphatase, partial [Myxococcota bacterium]|nr:metallophosphatase [Myxococcota bacterium]
MVVGHTTQRSGEVATRCGGALLGIDTGISSHYGGHLAAVELKKGDAWAIYPTGPKDLQDP